MTAALGNSARVWSATSGTELFRLGHDGIVNTARFSANGARVVTASDDNTARVWDASTGTELARLRHDGMVRSAVFSADSARVVTASWDNTARVWDTVWLAQLTGGRLVRAAAQERLKGAGLLTEAELRTLEPLVGDIKPDVASRWLSPSPDDVEIATVLVEWRRHRGNALALTRNVWTNYANQIRAEIPLLRLFLGPSELTGAVLPTRHASIDPRVAPTPGTPPRARRWLIIALLPLMAILVVAATWSTGFWR